MSICKGDQLGDPIASSGSQPFHCLFSFFIV